MLYHVMLFITRCILIGHHRGLIMGAIGVCLWVATTWVAILSAITIIGELAATEGLGYRVFLVRRYLAMDVILPYVFWITLLAFIIDRLLLMSSKKLFPWHHIDGDSL